MSQNHFKQQIDEDVKQVKKQVDFMIERFGLDETPIPAKTQGVSCIMTAIRHFCDANKIDFEFVCKDSYEAYLFEKLHAKKS